jgi:hypothetical protein
VVSAAPGPRQAPHSRGPRKRGTTRRLAGAAGRGRSHPGGHDGHGPHEIFKARQDAEPLPDEQEASIPDLDVPYAGLQPGSVNYDELIAAREKK